MKFAIGSRHNRANENAKHRKTSLEARSASCQDMLFQLHLRLRRRQQFHDIT